MPSPIADSGSGEAILRLVYDRTTDSLYIELAPRPGADAIEVTEGIVLDVDAAGAPVGIDIQHASQIIDLSTVDTDGLPAA